MTYITQLRYNFPIEITMKYHFQPQTLHVNLLKHDIYGRKFCLFAMKVHSVYLPECDNFEAYIIYPVNVVWVLAQPSKNDFFRDKQWKFFHHNA